MCHKLCVGWHLGQKTWKLISTNFAKQSISELCYSRDLPAIYDITCTVRFIEVIIVVCFALGTREVSVIRNSEVSAIRGLLQYWMNGEPFGTSVSVRYKADVRISEVSTNRGSTVVSMLFGSYLDNLSTHIGAQIWSCTNLMKVVQKPVLSLLDCVLCVLTCFALHGGMTSQLPPTLAAQSQSRVWKCLQRSSSVELFLILCVFVSFNNLYCRC